MQFKLLLMPPDFNDGHTESKVEVTLLGCSTFAEADAKAGAFMDQHRFAGMGYTSAVVMDDLFEEDPVNLLTEMQERGLR